MKTTKKEPITYDTWRETLGKLDACKTDADVKALIVEEKAGACRPLWLSRMVGRLRILRNTRLDAELDIFVWGK